MPNRVVILYNQDVGGWSETHWRGEETLANTDLATRALLTLRFSSLTELTYIYGYRLTKFPEGLSEFHLFPNPNGMKLAATVLSDFPWTGGFFNITLANGHTMPFLLRGIPDIAADDRPGIFADYTPNTRTSDYLDGLFKSGTWGTRELDVTAGNPTKPLTSVTITGQLWEFTTGVAHGLLPRDYALFTAMAGMTRFPRRLRVISVADATHFTVRNKCSCGTFTSGLVRKEKLDYVAYSKWDVKGARKRDTGRPFGLLSGRRRG